MEQILGILRSPINKLRKLTNRAKYLRRRNHILNRNRREFNRPVHHPAEQVSKLLLGNTVTDGTRYNCGRQSVVDVWRLRCFYRLTSKNIIDIRKVLVYIGITLELSCIAYTDTTSDKVEAKVQVRNLRKEVINHSPRTRSCISKVICRWVKLEQCVVLPV